MKAFKTIMPEWSKWYILAVSPYMPTTNTKQLMFPISRLHPFFASWTMVQLCMSPILHEPSKGSWLAFTLTSIKEATKCHLQSLEEEGALVLGCVMTMSGLVA